MIKFTVFDKVNVQDLPYPIPYYNFAGRKLIRALPFVAGKNNSDVFYLQVEPCKRLGRFGHVETQIVDRGAVQQYASHTYVIDPEAKCIDGRLMKVLRPRFLKNKLGEVMRLAGIIEMFENNANATKIFSIPSAVPFHSKYKFKPELYSKYDIAQILSDIKNARCSDADKKMTEMFEQKFASVSSDEEHDELIKSLNAFVADYVARNSGKIKDAGIAFSIPMKLDVATVKENADFFNGLFEAHKIDYRV